MMDVGHRRALNFHRIILLGFGAEIGQVIAGKIDPADERNQAVDHDDFAVQAAEPVGANAEVFGRRIEDLQMHAGIAQRREITGGQLAATEAVEADGGAHAALGGIDQNLLQLGADLVFENDEGLQQDFTLRRAHCCKHAGEIFLAVFQQFAHGCCPASGTRRRPGRARAPAG